MQEELSEIEKTLFQISRLAKGAFSVSTDLCSLSMLDIQTLVFLRERNGANMSEIAGHLNTELPSSTSLVNKLVKNNLVQRLPDESDRRVVVINLTETGEKFLTRAVEVRNEHTKKFLSYLSSNQKKQLLTLLKTIKKHLEK